MPVEIHVDLAALRANFNLVRSLAGPHREILACVKANAYGHGLIPCARTLVDAGADVLGIARVEEAHALRSEGIATRLMVLGAERLDAIGGFIDLDVEILVDSAERLDAVLSAGSRLGKVPRIHLAIDTGMGRFGCKPHLADALVHRIANDNRVVWAGVMTHFPVADTDIEYTRDQWRRFDRLTLNWLDRGIAVPCRHAANSAAIVGIPESHADMVRPGLMLYGLQPSPGTPCAELQPVLSWVTEVAALHRHRIGETIGYGRTFTAARDTLAATLPVGYGDGMPWSRANTGWVLIRGRRAPVIGRVSMDQTTVDVTDIDGIALGDEAVLLGTQGNESISAEQWAEWSGTINYEIVTRLLPRTHRIYSGGSGHTGAF